MNAMFLKVLREVLSGLLIPEPNVEGGMGSGEEEDREPWSGFQAEVDLHALGAIVQSIQEREREREHITNQK